MHRPFVTTVKFENENGGVMRLEYAVAAVDTADARTELERRFLDLEVEHYAIESIVEATTVAEEFVISGMKRVTEWSSTRLSRVTPSLYERQLP